MKREFTEDSIEPLEHELLIHFWNISNDHLRKLAIRQVKVLAEFDPEEMIIDSLDEIAERFQREDDTVEYLKNRRKKRIQDQD